MSSRGFTLIEALVALLVLSISLLGLAGMQLKGLQSGHVAYQRAVADLAAQDAGERLWEWLGRQNGLACPSDGQLDALQQQWIDNWADDLPDFSGSRLSWEDQAACSIDVTVSWSDARFTYLDEDDEIATENVSRLTYTVALPNA
nr:prepilin-type N-terminal cleavage/methylation domain-containing protein [Halomonas getboli]